MFRPVSAAVSPCEQTSQYGIGVVDEGAENPVGGCARRGRRYRSAARRHVAVDRRLRPAQHAVVVARGQVQRAARRLAAHGGVAVVAEREVLRVVPVGGDGIAVEVAHHRVPRARRRLVAELARVERRLRVEAHELVHEAAVARLLLGGVLVVLIAGVGLGAIDAERLGRVRISLDQRRREAVDRGRSPPRVKGRLPGRVERRRIGREVGVERVILLEDHHQVLDRRLRRGTLAGGARGAGGGSEKDAKPQRKPEGAERRLRRRARWQNTRRGVRAVSPRIFR